MAEHWQVIIYSINGFLAIVGSIFVVVRVNHYTKEEMRKLLESYQTRDHSEILTETQMMRNQSFINSLQKIEENIERITENFNRRIEELSEKNQQAMLKIVELAKGNK